MGGGVARAADQQGAGNFKVLLSDGSVMQGAISFVIDLDTQYGLIKISSSSMASARFDPARQWADVRLNEAELKLKYKPGTSDIKATTSAGPLNIELAKVVTIDNGAVPPPSASYPEATANQANVPPPPAYAQQAPQAYAQQPAPAYQYPPQQPYYYTAPYDYGYAVPDYSYSAPYYGYYGWPGYYGYGWPYFGVGFGFGRGFGGFGRGFGGFRGGFGHGFGGGFHGGGFGGHGGGGFGGHGGGGHR